MAAKFHATRATEAAFQRQLRRVARIVAGIVEPHLDGKGGIVGEAALRRALEAYAEVLGPWADRIVGRLIDQVGQSNLKAWEKGSAAIGKALRSEMAQTHTGAVARMLVERQRELIKSLPKEAGERAQKLAREAQLDGRRAAEVAEELARTEAVTTSRATLIARTEVAKANAALTQARAAYVGSTHYVWRTMGDAEVRETHADLEGEVFAWADPPDIPGEGRHHPGEFPNCRCFAEPVITGDEMDERREARYQAAVARSRE